MRIKNTIYKRILKILLRTIGSILGLGFCYLLAVCICSMIPVNSTYEDVDKGVDIYILTNGVHTDFVLPVKNEIKDWSREISTVYTVAKDTGMQFVAIGWGDKGFYMDTPTWADLKFSTAFKAAFFLSTTAMHTTFYKDIQEGEFCRKIKIDRKTYLELAAYIDQSFEKNESGHYIYIPGYSYERNDCFFEAKGVYNLFETCNTWVNTGLKKCGLKACFWTPFDKGIFYQYEPDYD